MITKYNYLTNNELLNLVPYDADPLMHELAQRVIRDDFRPERQSQFAPLRAPEQSYRGIE